MNRHYAMAGLISILIISASIGYIAYDNYTRKQYPPPPPEPWQIEWDVIAIDTNQTIQISQTDFLWDVEYNGNGTNSNLTKCFQYYACRVDTHSVTAYSTATLSAVPEITIGNETALLVAKDTNGLLELDWSDETGNVSNLEITFPASDGKRTANLWLNITLNPETIARMRDYTSGVIMLEVAGYYCYIEIMKIPSNGGT